jgi:hypothetical protein
MSGRAAEILFSNKSTLSPSYAEHYESHASSPLSAVVFCINVPLVAMRKWPSTYKKRIYIRNSKCRRFGPKKQVGHTCPTLCGSKLLS